VMAPGMVWLPESQLLPWVLQICQEVFAPSGSHLE